jgi:hypothetical protein
MYGSPPPIRFLQYAMRDRLTALGWSRIETVDDDLGRSAAGGVAITARRKPEAKLGSGIKPQCGNGS